jgi:hypothetical protein
MKREKTMKAAHVLPISTGFILLLLGCGAPQSVVPERHYLQGTPLVNPLRDSLARTTGVEPGSPVPATTIADTNTPVPGGQGDFTFFTFPTIGGMGVAFQGSDASQDDNIYLSSQGQLEVLIRVGAPYPELGAFSDLGMPCTGNDQVAFWGAGLVGGPGIYTARQDELMVVANTRTAVPGGTGTFTGFDDTDLPSVADGMVTFVGFEGDEKPGVYVGEPGAGEVFLVANTQSPIPAGQGNFTGFSGPAISGSDIAFFGNKTPGSPIQAGIYVTKAGDPLTKVADLETLAPDGTGRFQAFTVPTIDFGVVAFVSINESGSGVYKWVSGSLVTVANTATQVPGEQSTFASFNNSAPSSAGGTIVFSATTSEGITGIYASVGGVLVKVLDERDTIGGFTSIGAGLGLVNHQLSEAGTVAFYDLLSNGVYGIYTLPVPRQ